MNTFRFHFNVEYAKELRDAVNDRPKQSFENIHEDKQTKGPYLAWNRTCAAMDRLEDTISYLNQIELGKNINSRSAFDFYDFINNAYVVIDCIKTIGKIFRIDEKLFAEIEKSNSIFGSRNEANGSDQKYFEYIRSLCSVHPLCTNRQLDYLNGNKFHCCPFVAWKQRLSINTRENSDLTAIVYPSNSKGRTIYLGLYVSQFEDFLTKWIELIPKIIEAKNSYTDKAYEQLKNEPVKSLSDYPDNIVQYLSYLKEEYCKRFDYGSEYLFDDCIRVFTINISDSRNKELLDKYRNAILYSLQFVRNELQNMSFEGYDNTGLLFPDDGIETTLFNALCSISILGSSFSVFGYNLGKLYYLNEDHYDYADKRYARTLLEEAKGLINQYVNFTNTETHEETIVLVNLALYLEALTRKSLLNKNIPNDLKYRTNTLSEAQYKELLVEAEPDERQNSSLDAWQKILDEYGG